MPWARRPRSFSSPCFQTALSGPRMRCRYLWTFPVAGSMTELSCAVGVSIGCSKLLVVMFSCDDRKGYRWHMGSSGLESTICGPGWRGCGSTCGGGVGILCAQSVVGCTLRRCIGAKSVVGCILGGRVVGGTSTLGARTEILAVVVVCFQNSRDRVTSASACSVYTVTWGVGGMGLWSAFTIY